MKEPNPNWCPVNAGRHHDSVIAHEKRSERRHGWPWIIDHYYLVWHCSECRQTWWREYTPTIDKATA